MKRLFIQGLTVEGPAICKLISSDEAVIVQPLTDPVPEEVVRSIARMFLLPLQALYVDHLDEAH